MDTGITTSCSGPFPQFHVVYASSGFPIAEPFELMPIHRHVMHGIAFVLLAYTRQYQEKPREHQELLMYCFKCVHCFIRTAVKAGYLKGHARPLLLCFYHLPESKRILQPRSLLHAK